MTTRRDQQGIALLLTLLVISLLTAVTIRLSGSVNAGMLAARSLLIEQRLDALLYSGLSLARAALYADQINNKVDTRADVWAQLDQERIDQMFSGAQVRVLITDLSGLIPINALVPESSGRRSKQEQQHRQKQEQLQRQLWLRFLLSGRFAVEDENQARSLVDALADWIDPDDDPREYGAENSFYQDQDPPYACGNRPLQVVDELSLVKGFDRVLLYGDKEHEGILPYLTVRGRDGRINLNTAPAAVLQALVPGMDEEALWSLEEYRDDPANRDDLSRTDWYRRVPGFPGDLSIDQALLTVQSRYFVVRVRAGADGLWRLGQGELERNPVSRGQTLLSWLVDWTGPEEETGPP